MYQPQKNSAKIDITPPKFCMLAICCGRDVEAVYLIDRVVGGGDKIAEARDEDAGGEPAIAPVGDQNAERVAQKPPEGRRASASRHGRQAQTAERDTPCPRRRRRR